MSRNYRKRNSSASFVMLGRDMLRSSAWRGLSASAREFYIQLKAKYNGANNGTIRLHYSELRDIRGLSSPSTISKAISELEKEGWIEREQKGGLIRFHNEYLLTGTHDRNLNGRIRSPYLADYKKASIIEASPAPLAVQNMEGQTSPPEGPNPDEEGSSSNIEK